MMPDTPPSRRYLGTPALAYSIPKDAADASRHAYANPSWVTTFNPLFWLSWKRNMRTPKRTAGGDDVDVLDAVAVFQGPNYALAKSLQHWRAFHQRCTRNALVSARMAPPMRTESVTHVAAAKAFVDGVEAFPPNVVLDPETAAPLLCIVLLRDLISDRSNASPHVPLSHPMQLMHESAFHGGNWRCAYNAESVGVAVYTIGRTVGATASCHLTH